jgi:hypothetical protein
MSEKPESICLQTWYRSVLSVFIIGSWKNCFHLISFFHLGENIKKLLKLPFSNSTVSMIVHRVGKTLLIDDFDIHKYLLRRSATEWEWLRRYFSQTVLQQIDKKEGAVVRKNCSSSALQVLKCFWRGICAI